jgi:predicted FMN-binding regulatory protein PaiB
MYPGTSGKGCPPPVLHGIIRARGHRTLLGHVDCGNPQLRPRGRAGGEILAIVPGPHAQVSFDWRRANCLP